MARLTVPQNRMTRVTFAHRQIRCTSHHMHNKIRVMPCTEQLLISVERASKELYRAGSWNFEAGRITLPRGQLRCRCRGPPTCDVTPGHQGRWLHRRSNTLWLPCGWAFPIYFGSRAPSRISVKGTAGVPASRSGKVLACWAGSETGRREICRCCYWRPPGLSPCLPSALMLCASPPLVLS